MRRIGVVLGVSLFIACGGSSSDPEAGGGDKPGKVIEGCPIAPPAEAESGINDKCGLFVSSSKGTPSGDGSKALPFASLQKGIDAAKANGKRVYACAQSYREQITLADNVEIFGYFDCSGFDWKPGTTKAVIDGPSSPTVKATGIHHARIDGFEIRSPDATTPSGSSIAVVAISSPGVKIYNSKIHAGKGVAGTDGSDGIQLTAAGNINGQPGNIEEDCCQQYTEVQPFTYTCSATKPGCRERHQQVLGGTGGCIGAPEFSSPSGGRGGWGGTYTSDAYSWRADYLSEPGPGGRRPAEPIAVGIGGDVNTNWNLAAGQPGTDGTDGMSGQAFGGLNDDGTYIPSDGTKGSDGKPGQGGGGGGGHEPVIAAQAKGYQRYGSTGSGGGAGGCPGLSGTAGKGGGASLGIVAIQSPIQVFTSTLETAGGGNGGRGNTGTAYTLGGEPGAPPPGSLPGARGGNGGRAGISGSGAGGPSIGIAFIGVAPILTDTNVIPGPGGGGVEALRGDKRGTVPASPAGAAVLTFEFRR